MGTHGLQQRSDAADCWPRLVSNALPRVPHPIFAVGLGCDYRKDDVVTMLLELEHQLNSPKLVRHAKINCGGRTEEVHRSRTFASPGINIFEVKSGFFLLKKYSHTLRHTLRSLRFAPANCCRINYTCPNQKQAGLRGRDLLKLPNYATLNVNNFESRFLDWITVFPYSHRAREKKHNKILLRLFPASRDQGFRCSKP